MNQRFDKLSLHMVQMEARTIRTSHGWPVVHCPSGNDFTVVCVRACACLRVVIQARMSASLAFLIEAANDQRSASELRTIRKALQAAYKLGVDRQVCASSPCGPCERTATGRGGRRSALINRFNLARFLIRTFATRSPRSWKCKTVSHSISPIALRVPASRVARPSTLGAIRCAATRAPLQSGRRRSTSASRTSTSSSSSRGQPRVRPWPV